MKRKFFIALALDTVGLSLLVFMLLTDNHTLFYILLPFCFAALVVAAFMLFSTFVTLPRTKRFLLSAILSCGYAFFILLLMSLQGYISEKLLVPFGVAMVGCGVAVRIFSKTKRIKKQ